MGLDVTSMVEGEISKKLAKNNDISNYSESYS